MATRAAPAAAHDPAALLLLRPAFVRVYRAELDGPEPLVEHELDHVFVGQFTGNPVPAPAEVSEWVWAPPNDLLDDIEVRPECYTPWFRLLCDEAQRAHVAGA